MTTLDKLDQAEEEAQFLWREFVKARGAAREAEAAWERANEYVAELRQRDED